jgi:hypothetical protein
VLVSQAAIDGMLAAAAAKALTLRLVDATPGANISYHLREWAGDYVIHPDGADSYVVTFSNPKSYKSASDVLAGGIRGVFRVERGAGSSATAAAATAATAAAGGGSSSSSGAVAGGWGPSASRAAAAGSSSSTKAGGSRGPGSSKASSAAAAAGGSAGWQVFSSSKGKAAAAAPAAPPPDPWADDEPSAGAQRSRTGPAAAAAAARGGVPQVKAVEDWEAALEGDVSLPPRPALDLDQRNMWEALGDEA